MSSTLRKCNDVMTRNCLLSSFVRSHHVSLVVKGVRAVQMKASFFPHQLKIV